MPSLSRTRLVLLASVVALAVTLAVLSWPGGSTSSASPTTTQPSTTTSTTSTSTTTTTTTVPPTTEAPPPVTEAPPVTAAPVVRYVPPTAPPATSPPAPDPVAAGPVAAPDQASRSFALLNSWRAQNGLPALAYTGDAAAKAQAHAEEMAAAHKLWHTNLSSGLGGWSAWAENVGYAGSADAVHQMFVASAGHNANMLSADMTHVGVGAAISDDGYVYICQDFVG